ncbi:hypothetical protein FDG2_3909 [Candidatus Protofrankia californiensis]|uniref:Uncharacterized protein n=1 Tax=Candidatus Protofrankia californiensis TaxID=1839754 RepID=A0A1C3P1R5_9ACTN|nr:hypothetical protein FDG2_3909 [Candidatus Protofrankia californiensis]
MTRWLWAYGPWREGPQSDVGPATNRTITWRLTGRHEASYNINAGVKIAIWLGDLVRLRIRSGYRDVDALYRVQEIGAAWSADTDHPPDPAAADADGVTVGAIPPDRRLQLRTPDRRLAALERR